MRGGNGRDERTCAAVRVNRTLLAWGIFLVILGGIPLAVRLGGIPSSTLADAWRIWPVVIVGIGLAVLLRNSPWSFVGGLIVAATLGVVASSFVATGGPATSTCSTDRLPSDYNKSFGTFGGPATVVLSVDCGRLAVSTAAGSDWTAQVGKVDNLTPDVKSEANRLTIESKTRSNGVGVNQPGDDISVVLPTGVETTLQSSLNLGSSRLDLSNGRFDSVTASTNLGDMRLNLTGATARALTFTTNLGSASLTLPDTSMTASVTSNLGSLKICVPSGVGLQVTKTNDTLATINWEAAGLTKVDATHYQSANWATAVNRIEMTLGTNLGSVSFNPSGGCS